MAASRGVLDLMKDMDVRIQSFVYLITEIKN